MSSDDEFDGILDEFDNKNTEDKNNFDSVINQTLESLSLNQNNENDDDDDDDNLDSILESVMTELLSKDILYEPLKELSNKVCTLFEQNYCLTLQSTQTILIITSLRNCPRKSTITLRNNTATSRMCSLSSTMTTQIRIMC